jgi:hypothetical protein
LGGFAGNDDVRVRFRLSSNGGAEFDGIYIDDVKVISYDIDNAPPLILHRAPVFCESQAGDITLVADLIAISGIANSSVW